MARENVVEKTFAEQIADKKKRKTKIIASSVFAIIFAIAVVIVSLACVPFTTEPTNLPSASSIRISTGTTTREYGKTEDLYIKFKKIYEKSFESKYLTAIFSGRMGKYTISQEDTSGAWITAIPGSVTSGNFVVFDYWTTEPVLKDKSGKDMYAGMDTSQTIKIETITFGVSDSNTTKEIDMYVKYTITKGSGTASYYVKISTTANTYAMNEFIVETLD